jgi:hypothetical protein
VTATIDSGTMLDVRWVAPISDGGAAIHSWVVIANPGGRECWWTPVGSTRWCLITGITPGVEYTVTVAAVNPVGVGPATVAAPVAATPVAANVVAAPVIAGTGTTNMQVRWGLPTTATSAVAVLTPGVTGATSPTAAGSIPLGVKLLASGQWAATAPLSALKQGHAYTITVFVKSASGVLSEPVSKTFNGTVATGPGRPIEVQAGRPVRILWRVTTHNRLAVSRERVSVFARRKGSTGPWRAYRTALTDARGYAVVAPTLVGDTEFQLRYAGSSRNLGSTSPTVLVRPWGAVSTTLRSPSVRRGRRATITGSVMTNSPRQTMLLQKLVSGRWLNVATTTATPTKSYVFVLPTAARGAVTYRVVRATAAGLAAAVGPPVTQTVT